MCCRCQLTRWPLMMVAALVVSLTLGGASQADKKPKPAPKKAAVTPAATTLRFEEAQALRKAFVGLAGGNHNYNGHRVKAMGHLKAALQILDDHVLTHGTKAQQAGIRKGQAVAKEAEAAGNRAAFVHVGQGASDGMLRQSGKMLVEVRATVAANKQTRVLPSVDSAIQEVGIALKTQ